ncbi:MAG: glycosyltransferase 87 family protein, partial [Rubrobacter sp.]
GGLLVIRSDAVQGSPLRSVLQFWAPLVLLGACLYWGLHVLFARLPADLVEGSNDLAIYRQTGEALLRGEIPYRDFFLEYPPASLPAFVPPALISDSRTAYINLFASEMALVLVATLVLTCLTAHRIRGIWGWPVPGLTFAASALLLYPVAVSRYDAVVALTLAVAALCATLGGRYLLLAYASLGFGAAAKLVPALATLPLAFLRRRVVRGYAVFFATLAIFLGSAVILGRGRFLQSLAYHADRGLQVESLAASVLMVLGRVEGIAFEYGAFEVRGSGVDLAVALSLPVTGVVLALTVLAMYRGHRAGELRGDAFPRYAAALILAFMLGSKVLSPQYMIWLLPLVPLSFGGRTGAGISVVFLAVCLATTLIFPTHYADLLNARYPGPELLLGRNLLLVFLWGLLLLAPAKVPEKSAS